MIKLALLEDSPGIEPGSAEEMGAGENQLGGCSSHSKQHYRDDTCLVVDPSLHEIMYVRGTGQSVKWNTQVEAMYSEEPQLHTHLEKCLHPVLLFSAWEPSHKLPHL